MVKILSDSTCDLSQELVKKYQIGIIPLYVHLGEEEYQDGVNIVPEDLYRWSDEHKETPKTAAPSIEDVQSMLDPDSGDEYVIFTISSSMSTSYNNCILAAEDLDMSSRTFVIDSANLSTGIGLQVLAAAEMAADGMSGAQIAAEIEKMKDKVRASFVIDTLTYLYRGGRCSGLAALFGSALKLVGIDHFLSCMTDYMDLPGRPEDFGARVYKISRDDRGERLTFLKITGGTLKVRSLPDGKNKINQIRIYSGAGYEAVSEAAAGTVCAVTG